MKNLQVIFHVLVDLHDCSLVSTSVAVVRSGEDCHDITLVCPVVSIHDQLMRSGDSRQVIRVVELLRDVLTETIAGAARADTPTTSVIGVGPEQVAHRSFVRHLDLPVNGAYLIERVQVWREAAVQAENLIFDDCGQWQ